MEPEFPELIKRLCKIEEIWHEQWEKEVNRKYVLDRVHKEIALVYGFVSCPIHFIYLALNYRGSYKNSNLVGEKVLQVFTQEDLASPYKTHTRRE